MRYVLSYDLGTSSIKASVIDSDLNVVASAVRGYETYVGANGIREQCPADWEQSMVEATKDLREVFPNTDEIEAIGISGHSLGVVAVDSYNQLLVDKTPIWSDARASRQADEFFESVDYKQWYNATGNGFTRQLYAVFKIMWYKDNLPQIYDAARVFLGTKDYLNMRLTGCVCTDYSYASGSGVYNLAKKSYDKRYIEKAKLKASDFPRIVPSDSVIGTLTSEMQAKLGLTAKVKVVAGGVDNACMSLGAACFEDGDAYVSLGSSAWIATANAKPVVSFDKKIYTWAHCVPDMYIPSSGIFSASTSLEWVLKNLFADLDDKNKYDVFNSLAEHCDVGANGVFFCPILSGGSGVDVAANMKGGFVNIDLATTRNQLARATLEGIAYELRLSLDALQSIVTIGNDVLFVGGGANSDIWCRIFADIFNKNVIKKDNVRSAASIGAAALAMVGAGIATDYTMLKQNNGKTQCNKPSNQNVERYQKGFDAFVQVCQAYATICKNTFEEGIW